MKVEIPSKVPGMKDEALKLLDHVANMRLVSAGGALPTIHAAKLAMALAVKAGGKPSVMMQVEMQRTGKAAETLADDIIAAAEAGARAAEETEIWRQRQKARIASAADEKTMAIILGEYRAALTPQPSADAIRETITGATARR